MKKASLFTLGLLFLLSLLLFQFGCSRKSGEETKPESGTNALRKVVLIGVDAGDWENINPLIEKGRLPNFKKLIEDGATGPLRSMEPMLSPLLWTTIGTGKTPEEHGILSFHITDPTSGHRSPVTRLYRKVDALWNFLSDYDRKVGVVGWLATYPAELVNGILVSDKVGFLAYSSPDEDTTSAGRIFPSWREKEIEALISKGNTVTYEEFKHFLNIDRTEFEREKGTPFDPKNPVNFMIMLYATAKSYTNIGMHILEKDQPDFLGVYFEFIDAVGHLFMPYAPPKQEEVPQRDYDRYSCAMTEAYVYQDSILGAFMGKCDDNTVFMVVSDHGFKSGNARLKGRAEIWAGKAAQWHRMNGIIALYGKGIKPGFKLQGASVLDITPTVLALEGLPKAGDMPGKVLKEAFTPQLTAEINPEMVATLERKRQMAPDQTPASTEMPKDMLKKLEALGYISSDDPNTHNNLGQRYEKEGQFEKAISEYQQALKLNPRMTSALNNLGVCYSKLKRFKEAEDAFQEAISINPKDAFAMNNLAVMRMEQNRLEEARKYAENAVKIEPNYANANLTLGAIYATIGEKKLAEKAFKKVLQIDPTNRDALENLRKLQLLSRQK